MDLDYFKATEQVYLSAEGRMVYPDEIFSVPKGTKKGKTWQRVTEDGEPLPEPDPLPDIGTELQADPDLDTLDLPALRALATEKGLTITGNSKQAFVTALRAAADGQ